MLIPVKTGLLAASASRRASGANGGLVWSADSDYVLPAAQLDAALQPRADAGRRVYAPGRGRQAAGARRCRCAPRGHSAPRLLRRRAYAAAPATSTRAYSSTRRSPPIPGNVFFGFHVTGANPAGLVSGIARVAPDGTGIWVGGHVRAADAAIAKPAMNSAPALSIDWQHALCRGQRRAWRPACIRGLLLALDSTTLATRAGVALTRPDRRPRGSATTAPRRRWSAPTATSSTACWSAFPAHNARGWLLHFDATLSQAKTPGHLRLGRRRRSSRHRWCPRTPGPRPTCSRRSTTTTPASARATAEPDRRARSQATQGRPDLRRAGDEGSADHPRADARPRIRAA